LPPLGSTSNPRAKRTNRPVRRSNPALEADWSHWRCSAAGIQNLEGAKYLQAGKADYRDHFCSVGGRTRITRLGQAARSARAAIADPRRPSQTGLPLVSAASPPQDIAKAIAIRNDAENFRIGTDAVRRARIAPSITACRRSRAIDDMPAGQRAARARLRAPQEPDASS
jgi:hypothetical protein